MKQSKAAVRSVLGLILSTLKLSYSCPLSGSGLLPPNDIIHGSLKHASIQRKTNKLYSPKRRALQEDCFSAQMYDEIDADVVEIADTFLEMEPRSHFLGGIVRLAAHDFLDYNRNASITEAYGPDGCIDFSSSVHAGLEDIWCDEECPLTRLYEAKYSTISRADFWIASAHAVIRLTSSGGLDLKSSFVWGRIDRDVCPGSAERLPEPTGCDQVEEVFLNRLGLSYVDAVALIGGHTLGRGDADFSGHHGIWVDTVEESLVFDKRFYEEIYRRAWVPRNENSDVQDWTWGGRNGDSPRFMLNTDMCLVFNIDEENGGTFPCCTRTDLLNNNGQNPCQELNETACVAYTDLTPQRKEAADAVELFATGGGNGIGNDNNEPFYQAFQSAWIKATTIGWDDLRQLSDTCATTSPSHAPSSSPSTPPTSSSPTIPVTHAPTKSSTLAPTSSSPTSSNSNNPTASLSNKPTTSNPSSTTSRPTRRIGTKAGKLAKTMMPAANRKE